MRPQAAGMQEDTATRCVDRSRAITPRDTPRQGEHAHSRLICAASKRSALLADMVHNRAIWNV